MPSAFDGLPRTQLGDIVFPAEVHDVDGEYRHHVHEYPHSDGGATEKLGRKLYHFNIVALFQATFTGYPDLYPNGMNTVRSYFEQGKTIQFTHPTIGTFPVLIVRWKQNKSARVRSGEKVTIEVLEQQQQEFLATTIVSADDTAIGPTMAQLRAELALIKKDLNLTRNDVSLLDALQAGVNSVLAVRDTTQMVGNLYASNLQSVISLCEQLDVAASMQDPRAWPVVEILLTLLDQTRSSLNDLHSNAAQLKTFTVPYTQSLLDVTIHIYGDATRLGDLISLNSVDDVSRVPAGTSIRYYALTPQQQSAQKAA